MELALIPPNQFLETTQHTRMQLMLPHELMHNKEYHDHYGQIATDPAYYVILDNGAAEGEPVSGAKLASLAVEYNADEVACPDVLGEIGATLHSTGVFLDEHGDDLAYRGIRIGAVAQGRSVDEVVECIRSYQKYWPALIKTIYVPRLLVNVTQNKHARFHVLDALSDKELNACDYHFFGASCYVKELQEAARDGRIRSFDTSLPYNYGYYMNLLEDLQDDWYDIRRPKNYFQAKWDSVQGAVTFGNVSTMTRWANGEE